MSNPNLFATGNTNNTSKATADKSHTSRNYKGIAVGAITAAVQVARAAHGLYCFAQTERGQALKVEVLAALERKQYAVAAEAVVKEFVFA
jgi:hypothetical protein